jgi:hypothetical protein
MQNDSSISRPLVLMACSSVKLDHPAKALDLYRGVMYQSYRKHVSRTEPPTVIILSALHGFVSADTVLAPYDQRMTPARSVIMMSDLAHWMQGAQWPTSADHIFLAGGALYRTVMRSAIGHLVSTGAISGRVEIQETSGAIGVQRSQLGEYLRRITN